uniref:Uncharacterized protein n=1 Tax=Labrus bergylta TaxID=56723 RepID=A0A3Q3F1S3_9LABR
MSPLCLLRTNKSTFISRRTKRGENHVKRLHLVRLPVAQGLQRDGSVARAAPQLQGSDGGAASPQVGQQLLAVLHRLLPRLRNKRRGKNMSHTYSSQKHKATNPHLERFPLAVIKVPSRR